MQKLRIGDVYQPIVGRGEGCFFDFDGAGAKLIYSYNRPTAEEIADMSAGKPFEIRYMETGGIIWTAHKCGGQQWNDCSYNPRLSHLTNGFPVLDGPDSGMALLFLLCDAADGTIRHLRMIGLSHKFSASLLNTAARLRETPLSADAYLRTLADAPRRYTSQQIADLCPHYCKVRGGGA